MNNYHLIISLFYKTVQEDLVCIEKSHQGVVAFVGMLLCTHSDQRSDSGRDLATGVTGDLDALHRVLVNPDLAEVARDTNDHPAVGGGALTRQKQLLVRVLHGLLQLSTHLFGREMLGSIGEHLSRGQATEQREHSQNDCVLQKKSIHDCLLKKGVEGVDGKPF